MPQSLSGEVLRVVLRIREYSRNAVLDVSRRTLQPLPRLRYGVADHGLVDVTVGEEGDHETACCRASSCAAKASTTSSSVLSAWTSSL